MTTDTKSRKKRAGDLGRVPYRFTAEQVMKMIESGIIGDGEDVELWDGILYKMTRGELHNTIVMLVARTLWAVIDADAYHVREEKSNVDGARSLPEPDVTVTRGRLAAHRAGPPALEEVALAVEVDHHTARADGIVKLRRYAARGIPVYWIIKAKQRLVQVHDTPRGHEKSARYTHTRTFSGGDEVPIAIDGREVGRVVASDLFPPVPAQ